MTKPKTSDEEFVKLFRQYGAQRTADILNVNLRSVYSRRRQLEKDLGEPIHSPNNSMGQKPPVGRITREITDGTVIVFSDCHYWPDIVPVMHKALVKFCKKLKPKYVIANGDVLDFPSISRWDALGWERRPLVSDELETGQIRLEEVRKASGDAELIWTLGNHDARYEASFAKHLPEMVRVKGLHLKDHFPHWQNAFSVWFNDHTVVKHRLKGGIHAVRNNVVASQKNVVTGHLHSAKITPVSCYDETLWGMDCGTIADCFGPQFLYIEDNPRDWRSAFGVLTFRNGQLLPPELVTKHDDEHVTFRGEVIPV